MTDTFDPYHKGLGIPVEEQPPNHYRLLGVKRFETDGDAIENAADQRMGHLRTFQLGAYAAQSQSLLNQVAAAKKCLMDPHRRAAYDTSLIAVMQTKFDRGTGELPLGNFRPATLPSEAKHTGKPTSNGVPLKRYAISTAVIVALLTAGGSMVFFWPSKPSDVAAQKSAIQPPDAPTIPPQQAQAEPSIVSAGNEPTAPTDSSPETATDSAAPAEASQSVEVAAQPAVAAEVPKAGPQVQDAHNSAAQNSQVVSAELESVETDESKDDRLPVPDQESQKVAGNLARDLYKEDFAKANSTLQRKALAQKLLKIAEETRDDAASRFVLLKLAKDTAEKAGDHELAFQAIETVASEYRVEAAALKLRVLESLSTKARATSQHKRLVDVAVELVHNAIEDDEIKDAEIFLAFALREAKSVDEPKALLLVEKLETQVQEFKTGKAELLAAEDKLRVTPDDPNANLVIGKYRCFAKQEWVDGLPNLARCADEKLKQVAQSELKAPKSPQDQTKLADDWFDIAEAESGATKIAILTHAAEWYRTAVSGLAGINKIRVEKRLEEIAAIEKKTLPAEQKGKPNPRKTIDLLAKVDVAKSIEGRWVRKNREIIGTGNVAALAFPASISGSYRIDVSFTRVSGNDTVGLVLPLGDKNCGLQVCGFYGAKSRLMVNGKEVAKVEPGPLTNNQVHKLVVDVNDRGDDFSVAVTLDGKPYLSWQGGIKTNFDKRVPKANAALSVSHTPIIVHSAKATLLRKAQPDRATPAGRK